jgi:CRISPR-associated Cas5-like protein
MFAAALKLRLSFDYYSFTNIYTYGFKNIGRN